MQAKMYQASIEINKLIINHLIHQEDGQIETYHMNNNTKYVLKVIFSQQTTLLILHYNQLNLNRTTLIFSKHSAPFGNLYSKYNFNYKKGNDLQIHGSHKGPLCPRPPLPHPHPPHALSHLVLPQLPRSNPFPTQNLTSQLAPSKNLHSAIDKMKGASDAQ